MVLLAKFPWSHLRTKVIPHSVKLAYISGRRLSRKCPYSSRPEIQEKTKAYMGQIKVSPQQDGCALLLFREKPISVINQVVPLILPSPAIGELLLAEWAGAFGESSRKSAPLTALLYRANDIGNSESLFSQLVDEIVEFFHTDSLCFVDRSSEFHSQESQVWGGIIGEIIQKRSFHEINVFDKLGKAGQSGENINLAKKILQKMSNFDLAAFELLTRSFKSFLLPLALYDTTITVEAAVYAANLESRLQSEKWGIIEDFHSSQNAILNINAHLGNLIFTLQACKKRELN